jgi:hypothetical protein
MDNQNDPNNPSINSNPGTTWATPPPPPPPQQPAKPATIPPTLTPPPPMPEPPLPEAEPTPIKSEPTVQPSWNAASEIPPQTADAAPTDLSHLITNSNTTEIPTQPAVDTLVVPPANNGSAETPATVVENHKGIPRWLIGLGLGLLVLVAGASAYFIIGIGQNKNTTSVPAEITPPALPTNIPQPTPQPASSGSANFGDLEGSSGSTPTATTSSLEILRQRQQSQ